jgi:hypothetical protein
MPTAARTQVRLLGIPLRHQGTHDSLCAYYAAAMMLTALRPELEDHFEAGDVRQDPLFGHYPRGRQQVDALVATWIASGVQLEKLTRALDGACQLGVRTRFAFSARPRTEATLTFLRQQIDAGLPTVVGWESREMGLHTVCVVGYERHASGSKRREWLRVLDPARLQDVLEWSQLARLATRKLEVIHCAAHDGIRPDKLTSVRRGDKTRTHIERFDARAGGYSLLVK